MPNEAMRRFSIARAMLFIALVGGNCALLREFPWWSLGNPTILCLLGVVDFVIVWKVTLSRPFQAAQYTFLTVFVVAYLVLVNLATRELIHPTGPLIPWYQRTGGMWGTNLSLRFAWLADIWATVLIAFLLAGTVAWLAAWLERKRGWDIAAFFRGALVGFGTANVVALLSFPFLGEAAPGSLARYLNLGSLTVCVVAGGFLGLRWLKSKPARSPGSGD